MNRWPFIFLALLLALARAVPSAVQPQTQSSYYDPQADCLELGVTLSSAPQVEFLEAGTSPSVQTDWKLYGPDLNGKYGGLNGVGGLEGVSPYLNTFNPIISDARGNVLAEITNGVASWILARPDAYGTVPGYRAVAYGNGVDEAQSSVYLGHAVDVTGNYYFHNRYLLADSHQWSSYDPKWNECDPNGYTFCGGDPIDITDPWGLLGKDIGPSAWDSMAPNLPDNGAAYVDSYYQTEAQMAHFEQYGGSGAISDEQAFSSMVDMIPIIGGLKMWYELGTGVDSVTGQHIDSSDWSQVALIGLNFLPMAFEAAPEEAAIESQVNIPFAGVGQQAAPTATQLEFDFVNGDLSGQLTSWETSSSATAPKTTALIPYKTWPSQDGFLGGYTQPVMAQQGQTFSRIGALSGTYVAPPGTSLSARGLPPNYPDTAETIWEVVKPFDMQGGISAPWQGSSGLGVQFKLPQSVNQLYQGGYINPVIQ